MWLQSTRAILTGLFFQAVIHLMSETGGSRWVLVGVGTMLTSIIVAGFILGYGVDRWLDSQPIFMVLFGGLGLIGGILKVYKLLSRLI